MTQWDGWRTDAVKLFEESISKSAQKIADDINVGILEEVIKKAAARKEYREEVFGGLSEEQILDALKEKYPENFV